MTDFWILPSLIFNIIDKEVIKLKNEVPSTKNKKLILASKQACSVTTSRLWWISFCFRFSPLESGQIKLINIVKSCSVIINTTMTTKDYDFVFIMSHWVIGPWFRSSNFGHRIFWCSTWFLIGRLAPNKVCWVIKKIRSFKKNVSLYLRFDV